MDKNSSTFSFKKLPTGALIALLLIVSIEYFIQSNDDLLYKKSTEGLRISIKNEISQDGEYSFDILVLGDCQSITQFDPRIIWEKTGITNMNFATHKRYTILSSYSFFKNYIEIHKDKPRYVVISYLPSSIQLPKKEIIQDSIPNLYDLREGNIRILLDEFGFDQTLQFMLPSLNRLSDN